MKTIIAGSRHITDYRQVVEQIEQCPWLDEITEVVCGNAKGVDTIGMRWAQSRGIPVRMFYPDWRKHGKAAGPIRNTEMVEYADALILIWDGESKGSADIWPKAVVNGLRWFERVLDIIVIGKEERV